MEFGYLSDLETLDMSFNGLSGEVPIALGDLENLVYLDLSDNELNGQLPAQLGTCRNWNFCVSLGTG